MARWKLMSSHYVNVPGTEWEYREVDRGTGREKRKRVAVPRYLDVNDPADWCTSWGRDVHFMDGEIVICHEGKGEQGDIVFIGDPTPEMSPVDDEAREISKRFEDLWRYKPDTAEVGFSQSLVEKFQAEKAEAEAKPQTVQIEGMGDFISTMAAMAKQNQEMLAMLASQHTAQRRL